MRSLVAVGLIMVLLFPFGAAHAQVSIDVSKITCDQFVHAKISSPRVFAAWLSGFYNGRRNNTALDKQSFETNLSKLEKFCYQEKNFGVTVMQAIEQLAAANK